MVYQIAQRIDAPRRLSQAMLQVVDMPGLYQAELACILRRNCGDIGRLAATSPEEANTRRAAGGRYQKEAPQAMTECIVELQPSSRLQTAVVTPAAHPVARQRRN